MGVYATAPDSALVRGYLAGDERCFSELYGRYRSKLVNFAARKTGDRDAAEDLVQEAFLRVSKHLHRYDPERKFSTWIYTITHNLTKNELRNRGRSPLVLYQALERRQRIGDRPIQFEDERARADGLYRQHRLQDIIEECVTQLSDDHQAVFRLRELEGRTYEEIADAVGVNINTVKTRLHRARNSFAKHAARHVEPREYGSVEDAA